MAKKKPVAKKATATKKAAFETGGVGRDAIRNITGKLDTRTPDAVASFNNVQSDNSSALFKSDFTRRYEAATTYGGSYPGNVEMSVDRNVPTGPEFSTRTLSAQPWRRVS